MQSISLADMPQHMTVIQYLEQVSSLASTIQGCTDQRHPQFFKLKLPICPKKLYQSYQKIKDTHGVQGWRTKNGTSQNYVGFSLTYNERHQDQTSPLYSTLGSEKILQTKSILYGSGDYTHLKDSYYDTYGFTSILPLIADEFQELFDLFKMQLIRSRVSEILCGNEKTTSPEYGWHLDEQTFYNLRVNIPLLTSPEYFLQIEGEDEMGNRLSHEEHLEVGYMYIWNTRIQHRAFAKAFTPNPRVHMVLGFSPWLNYVPETNKWVQNEFFGTHPLQLVKDQSIFNFKSEIVDFR